MGPPKGGGDNAPIMMIHLLSTLQSAAAIVFTFGLVIFLHESGHFFVCRRLGVRVEKFAFGMGPELFGVTDKKGTHFAVCALPLGGYVKPAGEDVFEGTGKPDEYFSQSWQRRVAIVMAGPIMNYVLAFCVFTGLIFLKGEIKPSSKPIIGDMLENYPAAQAGLKIGDVIDSINGTKIFTWKEMADMVHQDSGKPVELTYSRGDASATIQIVPKKDPQTGYGVIGIVPETMTQKLGFFASAKAGAKQCWDITALTVKTLYTKIAKRERPDLAGPVGIMQMVSKAAHSGVDDLFFLIGLISVAIGFFNFLPVPLLDGGHAALYLWEGISGRKLTQGLIEATNKVGIVFLVSLLIFATYNDILRLRGKSSSTLVHAASAAAPASQK
jgi:regulator of sigma E protease